MVCVVILHIINLCFTVLEHLQSLFYLGHIITQLTQMVTCHQVTQDLQTYTRSFINMRHNGSNIRWSAKKLITQPVTLTLTTKGG